MAATDYHFVDRWRVRGTVEEVADVLKDGPDMARWWPSTYREVRVIEPGDEHGVGQHGSVRAAGWLPYTIQFEYRVTESRYPHGFSLDAWGDLTGRGRWDFTQDGEFVDITYDWRIRSEKPLLRRLSFLLKPVFRSNHTWTMKNGERSLRIELARRRAAGDPVLLEALDAPPPPRAYNDGAVLHTSHSAFIQRPLDEVFAYTTDPANDLEWQPEIRDVTVTSPGPLGPGSTFREVRRTLGREFTWDMRITALVPGDRFCIEAVKGTVPYRGCRVFEAVDGGTWVTETSEVRLAYPMRPFVPLLRPLATRPVRVAYERLTALLESRNMSGPP